MNDDMPDALPGSARYRIVVRSAAEAVEIVRERFGDSARVLAVRQIEAGGLARFLQKPRLEVIVEAGAPPPRLMARSEDAAMPDEGAVEEDADVPFVRKREVERAYEKKSADLSRTGNEDEAPELRIEETFQASAPLPTAPASREISLLRATGLDELILERVRAENSGLDWGRTRAPEALGRVSAWLRREFVAIPRRSLAPRRVFIGPCGAGKTTALCKLLAQDVFVHGRQAAVLKLDGENPNATDGLAAFCDVLGAPLLRSASEVGEFDRDSMIYLDLPGISLDAVSEHRRLSQTLDALEVGTRILVINAGWESELINDAYEMGRACGATHVYFSHCDEVRRPGKLWRFALFGGLRPLACGMGPSPAGELDEDVFNALLGRTVPAAVVRAVGHGGNRS